MKFFLVSFVLLAGGTLLQAQNEPCKITKEALAEFESLKKLVNQLTIMVEAVIGGPIPNLPVLITDPELIVRWNEVILTWSAPRGATGYNTTLITPDGVTTTVILSPTDRFTTTEITTGVSYTITITPILSDGTFGVTYTTEPFTPECPAVCLFIYAPVCGTDGNTYSNKCDFDAAQCNAQDTELDLAYEGPCITVDPCALIQCDVPQCPEGFVLGDATLPGECCIGCVDCAEIQCDVPVCDTDYIIGNIQGQCCPACVIAVNMDPCAMIQCGVPLCPEGSVLGDAPLPGDCCIGCVSCTEFLCDVPVCDTGYVLETVQGQCCPGCFPEVFADCATAQVAGRTVSGTYFLQPEGVTTPFKAFCDFDTEGGKWTVILRRDGTGGNFFRDYDDYVTGFGDVTEGHWLGLENLYRLNKRGNTEVLFVLRDHLGATSTGKYKTFRVLSAEDKYAIQSVARFSGNAGNSLFFNKGAAFSARDQDNDKFFRDCANVMVGGWWYKAGLCTRANLMGVYHNSEDPDVTNGMFWMTFRDKKDLAFVEMKIRDPLA